MRFQELVSALGSLEPDAYWMDIETPWPTYRAHVERALTNIIVSQKPEHGYQGAMHEASAWGLRKDGQVQHRGRFRRWHGTRYGHSR